MAAPVPLSGWARGWASTGTSTPKTGVRTVVPTSRGEAGVVGMDDDRHARRQQLRPGGVDQQPRRRTILGAAMEHQAVVGARALPVLQLGLGHRGLEVDVPEGRRLGRVGLAAGQHPQEAPLRRPLGACPDGRVVLRPVNRQPQPPPDRLERLLVLGDQGSHSSTKFGRDTATASWPLASPPARPAA